MAVDVLIHLNVTFDTDDAEEATTLAYAYLRGHNVPIDHVALIDPQ